MRKERIRGRYVEILTFTPSNFLIAFYLFEIKYIIFNLFSKAIRPEIAEKAKESGKARRKEKARAARGRSLIY